MEPVLQALAFQESRRWWEDGNAPCEKNTPEPAEETPFGEVDPPVKLRECIKVDRNAINLGGTAEDAFRPIFGRTVSFFVCV